MIKKRRTTDRSKEEDSCPYGKRSMDIGGKAGIIGNISKNINDDDICPTTRDRRYSEDQEADELEIDCKRLVMQEMLGEGAFGQVKRGLYQLKSTPTKTVQVAVKMLKRKENQEFQE